jgi:diguanylate cyclase (GGDEF)-like protein
MWEQGGFVHATDPTAGLTSFRETNSCDAKLDELNLLLSFARQVTANLDTTQVVLEAAKILYQFGAYDQITFSLAPGVGGAHTVTPGKEGWNIVAGSGPASLRDADGATAGPPRFVELPCSAGSLAIYGDDRSGAMYSDFFLSSFADCLVIALRNTQEHGRLKELTMRDALTGLYNRRGLEEMLRFEEARRNKSTLSLLVMDLDNFKLINDSYGHPVGDIVLEAVGRILRENARQGDIVARLGGEEFAVFLPATPAEGAAIAAERIRKRVAAENLVVDGNRIVVTVSIGIACSDDAAGGGDNIMARADQAMYQAKRQGKNRVCIFTPAAKVTVLRPAPRTSGNGRAGRMGVVAR